MPRPGKALAVACIAFVVVAAVLPLGGVSLDWFVVPAPFVLLQPPASTRPLLHALSEATPSAFVRTAYSRGPPTSPLA